MVHVPNLLSETFINACRPKDLAALQIPLNIFVRYLNSVAERCAELNDPVLDRLMTEMSLYSVGDPEDEDFDPELKEKIIQRGKDYLKSLKKA